MKKIITGITVEEQMRKAQEILETVIIPMNKMSDKVHICCGDIMREVKSSIGSYYICEKCGAMAMD